jgi:hypothetical protein
VAKNPSGGRAWCALRFDGCRFDEDLEAGGPDAAGASADDDPEPAVRDEP